MLQVSAYVGYPHPLTKMALEYLRSRSLIATEIERCAQSVEAFAVLIASTGDYPSTFLRLLSATTEEERMRRRERIAIYRFQLPELAHRAPHLIFLKPPFCGVHKGEDVSKFHQALAQACGLRTPVTPLSPGEACRRKDAALRAHKQRRSEYLDYC